MGNWLATSITVLSFNYQEGEEPTIYHRINQIKADILFIQNYPSRDCHKFINYLTDYQIYIVNSELHSQKINILAISQRLDIIGTYYTLRDILDHQISRSFIYKGCHVKVTSGQEPEDREIKREDLTKMTNWSIQATRSTQLLINRFNDSLTEKFQEEGWSLAEVSDLDDSSNSTKLLYRGSDIKSVEMTTQLLIGRDSILFTVNLKPMAGYYLCC